MSLRRTPIAAAALAAGVLLLAGCTPAPPPLPTATMPVQPAGDQFVQAESLTTPWSLVPMAAGGALVSERDTGEVVYASGLALVTPVGTVPEVVAGGEGGLLGLALLDAAGDRWLYAYLTTASDNRIVRMPLLDAPHPDEKIAHDNHLGLGDAEIVLAGLEKAQNHNGGRIAFGPDGMLYATVGDAGDEQAAQDRSSLNGKILRMTPEGGVPGDNPFAGSLVYSLGHRNPQGLAWDDQGRLWASEFGQDTWDEINLIEPGKNYGWPEVEGIQGDDRYVDPVVQWDPAEASPSGIAFIDGTLFVAALRGERIWALYPRDDGSFDQVPWFVGDWGRIRDVAENPDGGLLFLTSNGDGRGELTPGGDWMVSVRLEPLEEASTGSGLQG